VIEITIHGQKHVIEITGADENIKHRLSEVFDEDHTALHTGIITSNNSACAWKKQANEDMYDTASPR
jgi:hypothetical protein